MFDIHSVSLENFRSYAGKHHFVLPTAPGLYFLTGLNKREPKLGSNGAGKSTLLDAIYWCLFGRTLRGLRSADIVTWGEKSCAVSVDITIGTQQFTVTRRQSPNSLDIDGRQVDQDELQKHIGLGADSFVYAVILPQFGQSFFELTAANKLALFSQIMGLDYWLDRSKVAANKAETIRSSIVLLGQKIASANEWVAASQDEIEALLTKMDEFEIEQQAVITALDKQLDTVELKILSLKDDRKAISADVADLSEKVKEKNTTFNSIIKTYEKYAAKQSDLKVKWALAQSVLESKESAYKKLTKLGGLCPTCLQTIDTAHIKEEKESQLAAIKKQKEIITGVNTELDEAARFVHRTNKNMAQVKAEIEALMADERGAKNELVHLNSDMTAYERQTADIRGKLLVEQKRPNPYRSLIAEKQRALAALKAKLKQHTGTLDTLTAQHEAVSFWVAAFKRLRLFLIEETLRSLEVEVNSNLGSLGLMDWQVEFDVERENKSGGLTKGFAVFVTNSSHPEPVRWESWSGGEAQRLQLAGDLGLANLIMQQAGLVNTIEFYDEPSKHLSQEGLLDLAECLHQRAVEGDKRIFLIDHRTIEFGDFADTITVVKTKGGSAIE